MAELKPCPFCGGEVVQHHATSEELCIDLGYRFFCEKLCCMQVKYYETKEEAIEAWNRRAEDGK